VGDLSLGWVIAAGAAGAFVGDGISYALGRFVGGPVQERFFNGARVRRVLAWAELQLAERGGLVVILGRYVPGGRTAVTFTAGLTHYSYPRFAAYDAVAAITWATYASLLGYFGGQFFHDHVWAALLLAFGLAASVTLAVELVRRLRAQRAG
jgi:membrane protein DedA with SNARE-associated domain